VQESKPSTPAVHVSVHGRCSTNNCRHFRSPALTGVTGRGLVEDSSSLRKREQHSREEEVKKKGKVEGWEGERGLVEDELWAAHYWCAWERQIDLLLGRVAVLERHRQVVLLLLLLLGSLHHTNTHTNTHTHIHTNKHKHPFFHVYPRSSQRQCALARKRTNNALQTMIHGLGVCPDSSPRPVLSSLCIGNP